MHKHNHFTDEASIHFRPFSLWKAQKHKKKSKVYYGMHKVGKNSFNDEQYNIQCNSKTQVE